MQSPDNRTQARSRNRRVVGTPPARGELATGVPSIGQQVPQRKPHCACGGSCPRCRDNDPLQTQFEVSQPGDALEHEADRVAEQVLRMPQPELPDTREAHQGSGPRVSRYSSGAPAQSSLAVPPVVHDVVRSPGEPLDAATRGFFETRFGHDFGEVRIHVGMQAAASAQAADALAYTVGRNVVFSSGQYTPHSAAGRRLLAHELTHVVQQKHALPHDGLIQRKGGSPKAPTFRDCTESSTLGSTTASRELESARDRASDYVDVAISQLAQDPARYNKDASYRIALGRHFISPTATDRQNIRANYIKIRAVLKPEKIRCVASEKDREVCEKKTKEPAAFERGGETFLCELFWTLNHKCRAMVLIHEAAHAIGIGLGSPHPPYRGSTEYPFGAASPGADQSTFLRMDNPDAYSFFAAHIWREIDTECFAAELIRISEPAVDTKLLFEQAEECAKREALSPFCSSVMQEALKYGWGQK